MTDNQQKPTTLKLNRSSGSTSKVKVTVVKAKQPEKSKQIAKAKTQPQATKPRLQQTPTQRNNPLHGITLKTMVIELQEYYGWQGLFEKTKMNCFKSNPSIRSSLTFLRKTDWARDKVEQLYLFTKREAKREFQREKKSNRV